MKIKGEQGITLVALIVTIIVLIILAAVTIKGILEHNLISTTTEGIQKYDAQQKQETKMLNDIYGILDNTIKGLGTGESGNGGGTTTPEEPTPPTPPVPEDPRKDLTEAEKEQTKEWDTDKVEIKKDEDGKVVPVPKGFTPSDVAGEKKIDTGYVIKQDGTQNEFVWVPIVSGYEFGKLYDFGTASAPKNEVRTDTTVYREPDILTDTTYGDASTTSGRGIALLKSVVGLSGTNKEILADWKTQLESEYNRMLTSVTKYGGFYIGRYETGFEDSTKATVRKNNSASNIANQNWYQMYQKSKNLAKDLSIESTMIWGCQWDRCNAVVFNK